MDARAHAVMRFAFGVTIAFVVAELAQLTPTFLPPMVTGALLANMPARPPLKAGLGVLVLIAGSALIAALVCAAFRGAPVILFGFTVLIVFRALYAIGRGTPQFGPMFLMVCVTAVPPVAVASQYLGAQFAYALGRAAFVGVLVVYMVYLFWPKGTPRPPAPKSAGLPPALALRSALLGTAILAPLMLVYLLFALAEALPVIIATVMVVARLDLNGSRTQALWLIVANLAGGIASLLLIVMLVLNPSLITFILVLLAGSLIAGVRVMRMDQTSVLIFLAFNACLLVFSSSIGADSAWVSIWLTRLTHFLIAGAFSMGMMVLLWPRDREQTTT